MAEPKSPRPTLTEYFIISQLSSLKRGQEVAQGTRERQIVITGQILETGRQILATVTAMRTEPESKTPSFGQGNLWTTIRRLKDWAEGFEAAQWLWRKRRTFFVSGLIVSWWEQAASLLRWVGWL